MGEEIIEFTVSGSPRVISRAIEEFAAVHGSLHAIVVPWESDKVTLSMAVTSAKADGWAIEHTNLGTVKLTDIGNDSPAWPSRLPSLITRRRNDWWRFRRIRAPGARQVADRAMTELTSSSVATTLALRVAEARVEDIGHAIARLAPSDLKRIGAHAGDVLKITGGTIAVARAEVSDEGLEGSGPDRRHMPQQLQRGLAGASDGHSNRIRPGSGGTLLTVVGGVAPAVHCASADA